MNKLFALLLLVSSGLFAQCPTAPTFPGAIASDATLSVAGNRVLTTLAAPMQSTDNVAIVASSTGWAPHMLASADAEIMYVTAVSGPVLTVTRSCEGTTASAHLKGVPIANEVTAASHELLKWELEAVEKNVGPQFAVSNYGADPTGTNDSAPACNAAAAAAHAAGHGTVVFTPGVYKFLSGCTGTGTITFEGQGAVIVVPSNFNLSSTAVLILNYAQDPNCAVTSGLCPGTPAVKDIYIRFQNTDSGSYGALVAFPPGIACGDYYGCDWAVLDNIKITQAMTGIRISPTGVGPAWVSGGTYAVGQFASVSNITYLCYQNGCSGTTSPTSGGNWAFVQIGAQVRLSNIEISAFDYGIVMDGSDNEETISNYHFYPNDMTGNQGAIWPTHGTALWTAGLYDLAMTNFINSNFPGTMDFEYDPQYGRQSCTFATVSSLMVDTANGVIKMDCGQLSVAGGVWKLGYGQVAALAFSGTLSISSGLISNAITTGTVNTVGQAVTSQTGLNFAGLAAGGVVLIHGLPYTILTWNSNTSLTLTASAGTQTGVVFSTETPLFTNNGTLTITNVEFQLGNGGSWQIVSNISPGNLLFNDNFILNSGTGTTFLIPALYNHDGASIVAVGNTFTPVGSNSGTAILFDTGGGGDTSNWIADNYFNGWAFIKPNIALTGYYQLVPTGVGAPIFTGCGTLSNVGYSTLSQAGTFQGSASSCTLAIANLPVARGYACYLTDTTGGTTVFNTGGYTSTTALFPTISSTANHFFIYNCTPW